jgi:hypothetical protein
MIFEPRADPDVDDGPEVKGVRSFPGIGAAHEVDLSG